MRKVARRWVYLASECLEVSQREEWLHLLCWKLELAVAVASYLYDEDDDEQICEAST